MQHTGSQFGQSRVELDGDTFIKCIFQDCTLVYSGKAAFDLQQCIFLNCKWGLTGPARQVLENLKKLRQHGGEAKQFVEDVIRDIQK